MATNNNSAFTTRIYLVGMMGVGKSTLGKQLAKHYKYSFIDLDKEIERLENATVASIFANKGEVYFRNIELEVLLQTNVIERIVIATGGGTPCHHNNMEWMNANGKTVYLKATPPFIVSRLGTNYPKRPLLKDIAPAELQPFIEKLLDTRKSYYEQATTVVNMPIKSLLDTVKSIS